VVGSLNTTARRDLYLLISRLLREEVDAPLYRSLLATQGEDLLWIESAIASLPEEQALEQLAIEYCRLFVGPNPECPPFASMALGEALLGGRSRTIIDEVLTLHGLAIDSEARIASPDHVAVLFAALGEVSDIETAHESLRSLISPWMPSWLAILEQHARCAVFRTTSRLAAALIEENFYE
jgi:TorA maturation chaperone TorD